MFIKLQPDQVSLFWEMIKHGMISVYKIPKEFQQDFALKALENLLSGLAQAWIGFDLDDDGNKKIHFVMTTKMIDEKYRGIKVLFIDSLYGFRLMSDEMVDELYSCLEKFAKANNCNAIAAEYSGKRVEGFLLSQGFEKHITVCRKFLS